VIADLHQGNLVEVFVEDGLPTEYRLKLDVHSLEVEVMKKAAYQPTERLGSEATQQVIKMAERKMSPARKAKLEKLAAWSRQAYQRTNP
jgi:hypothetical protein